MLLLGDNTRHLEAPVKAVGRAGYLREFQVFLAAELGPTRGVKDLDLEHDGSIEFFSEHSESG